MAKWQKRALGNEWKQKEWRTDLLLVLEGDQISWGRTSELSSLANAREEVRIKKWEVDKCQLRLARAPLLSEEWYWADRAMEDANMETVRAIRWANPGGVRTYCDPKRKARTPPQRPPKRSRSWPRGESSPPLKELGELSPSPPPPTPSPPPPPKLLTRTQSA